MIVSEAIKGVFENFDYDVSLEFNVRKFVSWWRNKCIRFAKSNQNY